MILKTTHSFISVSLDNLSAQRNRSVVHFFLFVVPNLDEVPRLGEWTPGDVEPTIAGE